MNKLKKVRTGIFGGISGMRKKKQDISSSTGADNVRTNKHTSIRPSRSRNARIVQNFHLLWLAGSVDEVNTDDHHSSIAKLRQVVNTVSIFTDVNECIDFINNIEEEKAFMIASGTLGQTIVPIVHDKPQVSTIFIFCGNKARHETWAKEWPKITGVYTDIIPICEAVKRTTEDCDHNSVSISFVKTTDGASKESLDTLDSSFMYTQILKEILLTIDFEQEHINEFLTYCREQFVGNSGELRNVEKIRKEYRDHKPIWWYTYESLLFSMLNRALRLMEVDLIIKMGFFVHDLHNHIVALHAEQYGGHHYSNSFTVYRGRRLSPTDFEQLMMTQGRLMSFNNFLSANLNRAVSHAFAETYQYDLDLDLIGVLFEITVDPSITATSFANIENSAYYEGEEEILFSTHCVFRIGQVKQLDKNGRLWQVDLTLTGDNDPQLHALTEHMREETSSRYKGWHRLGKLMIKLGQFNKAEELYNILLEQTCNEDEKANIYHMLGIVKYNDGEYAEAITLYEKSIEIMKEILPPTGPDLAASYRNMGTVYDKMGDYSKALSYHEKALETYQNTISSNHFTYSASDDSGNLMNKTMDDCLKAIRSFEKAFKLLQETLPADDLSLATFYDRYGSVYKKMGDDSKALLFYNRALKIKEKHLPSNHPSLAASYASHADVYENMGDSATAHSFRQRAFDIGQRSLPVNHPDLQVYRQNVKN